MASRTLVYPYTLCGKLALFPYKFYYNNSPYFKYSAWGFVISLPFFYKVQRLSCSEANYVKLAEFRNKELEEYRRHNEHLD